MLSYLIPTIPQVFGLALVLSIYPYSSLSLHWCLPVLENVQNVQPTVYWKYYFNFFFIITNETGTYCIVAMSGNEQCLGEIVFHWSSTKSERLTVIY